MQIVVKPVPSAKWHGKEGKDSFARPQVIRALFDEQTGGYATGLNPEQAIEYGAKLGQDLSDVFDYTKPHPFWDSSTARIKLPNHTMMFDDTKSLEFVKIQVMKASKFVANSLKEWEDGLFPEATHIIYDEQEETEIKATKIQKRNKCVSAINKMSIEEKTNIVRLLSEKSVRGRSNEFIDVELDAIISDDTKIDEFIKYYKMEKADVTLRANITDALSRNILTKDGLSILYMGEPIGADFEGAVAYFKDPNHQTVKVAMMTKLEQK